ncbi:hypothetical protein HZA97_07480 [Candidatus Woesearchaeota archaeon]|nr:hypothetical protein [Candidatus Woesearchaeota archaeon]
MSRNFTKKISTKELEQKILEAWKKHEDFDEEYVEGYMAEPRYKSLTQAIEKDLNKVSFDTENISGSAEDCDYYIPELIGYHTLDNGLSFLGVGAGGDWECPVFFMLYWDGSELRGYIPTEGNPWNTKTKEAYGNNEEEDPKNAFKRGFINSTGHK